MTDVYIAGRFIVETGKVPCHWKDGERVDLDHAEGKSAEIKDALALDDKVYSVGYDDFGSMKVCLWVGGERHEFMPGQANCICAGDAGYIYIGGHDSVSKQAACWKVRLSDYTVAETFEYPLASGIVYGSVVGMCFEGGKLHMACHEYDGTATKYFTLSETIGSMQRTDLEKAKGLTGIACKDGKVYACGHVREMDTKDWASYWIDGELQAMLSIEDSKAIDIALKGDDVYLLGIDEGKPCYWVTKGSEKERTELDNVDGKPTFLEKIALDGDDVYVSGYYDMSTSFYAAFAMKNGDIILKENDNSSARGLAVVSYTK